MESKYVGYLQSLTNEYQLWLWRHLLYQDYPANRIVVFTVHSYRRDVDHMLRLGTHVVSAILNVGQKVDRNWPLHIQDNQGSHHQV